MAQTIVNAKAADLPVVRAHVRALDIVIGLITGGYPKDMMKRFISECVDLKQDGLLGATMMNGVNYLMSTLGEDVFRKLVEHLAERERIRKDDELVKGESELADCAGTVSANLLKDNETGAAADRSGTDGTGAAAKTPAKKQAGAKTAARIAAAGKKTVAQTRKRATGAADGK